MRGGSMICTETFGNGVQTGLVIIRANRLHAIKWDRPVAPFMLVGEAHGFMIQRTCVPLSDFSVRLLAATPTLDFESFL